MRESETANAVRENDTMHAYAATWTIATHIIAEEILPWSVGNLKPMLT